MKGKVFDIETKKVLSANFELILILQAENCREFIVKCWQWRILVCLPNRKEICIECIQRRVFILFRKFPVAGSQIFKDPVLKDVE